MPRRAQRKHGNFADRRCPYLRFGLTSLLLVSLFAVGCREEDDGRVTVYPTSGKVLVNGRPADGARIVFYPESPKVDGQGIPTPAATTDVTGQFQLESYKPADGAPAGSYKVAITWPEPPPPNAEVLGVYDQKDRLQGRYNDPVKSTLTATVPEGGGEIPPFELK